MSEKEPMSYREKVEAKRNEMVNTMLDFIQNNSAEWERGWYKSASEIPANGSTGKPYRGINLLYLMMVSAKMGYTDNRWVTFNQAHELGAHVKRGEKAREISYWSQYDKLTKKPFDEKTVEGMTQEEKITYLEENVRPVLKFYQVFNAEQCENFPERKKEELTPEMAAEERARQNALIEQVIKNSAAPITYGGSKAYYSPSLDEIHLPKIEDFKSMQDYYATALHEIAHSTGHESRLNRDLKGIFGTEDYAKEELRAELASVFMQTELGISIEGHHFENHGAYLTSWLKAVREDTKEFFAAARDAEKISDYVAEHYLQAERAEESAQEKNNSKESEAMPVFERNVPFAEQIDRVLSGADATNSHLEVLPTTPQILQDVGLPNLPILMTAKHLKSITQESGADSMNYHALGAEMAKRLPELLSNPVMIMDSLTRDDSIVVVTESVDKENRPVIGAIKVNGQGYSNEIEVSANILTSVYGRNNFQSFIERNIEAGNILFYNKKKSQELFEIPGIQFPNNLNSLDSDIIIRKSRAFVKPSAEKISENSSKEKEEFLLAWSQTPEVERRAVKEELLYAERMDFIDDETNAKNRLAWVREYEAQQGREQKEEMETRSNYEVDFRLDYSNEMLLSNELKKLGYTEDHEAYRRNEERDAAESSNGSGIWVDEIAYNGPDGKRLEGYYGKSFNGIMLESMNITGFTALNVTESEVNELAEVIRGFGVSATIEKLDAAETVAEAKSAADEQSSNGTDKTSQKPNFEANVPQERKWLNLDIPAELLGAEGESKARMIKLPQGEYSHFVLFVPKAWLKPGETEGTMKLSVDANSEYTIRNDGREVKLSGSELRAAFEGKEVGKSAQRTAPSRQSLEAMERLTANVPAEMKALPNWCVFRTKWNEEKGKKDKTIISPVDGKWAKSNDPSKWTDFETAKQYALEHGAEGLAFALDAASGISCIDLDKCIDKDGKLTETAQKLTSEISETYTETSASGNGIHIFLKDDILVGGKIKNRVETADGEIEVYDSGRFISMTGNVRTNVHTLGKTPQTTKAWLRRTLGERAPQQTFTPNKSVEGSDQEIIDRIRKSKKGPEFDALMAGENLANDHSRSDYRLLNMLAFFTDGNQEQMARIFQTSGLYRPEKGEPYLQRSIAAACKGLTTRIGQGQGGAFRGPSKGSSNGKGH